MLLEYVETTTTEADSLGRKIHLILEDVETTTKEEDGLGGFQYKSPNGEPYQGFSIADP